MASPIIPNSTEHCSGYSPVVQLKRMLAIGHGASSSLPASEALAIAWAGTSTVETQIGPGTLPELETETRVTITPED
jgi:hypothetical protein|tara:strand:- start:907 stop:1137 length:231 start_codon:yes stop_codon:yes gene_type:complete